MNPIDNKLVFIAMIHGFYCLFLLICLAVKYKILNCLKVRIQQNNINLIFQ